MMDPITFIVLGDPKGQPRPKAFAFKGHARVFDPGTAEGWKSQIAEAVRHVGAVGIMLASPLSVSIHCHFRRPKGHYGSGKNAHLLKKDAPDWHTAKPDFDNVAKAACDALTHLGVWHDDAQIVRATVTKKYSNGAPRTVITIQEATE